MSNKITADSAEYEISIRITFPEKISKALKLEKDRFVANYGSSYKSDPHITLYLDRYTKEGFPQLLRNLKKLSIKPFTISLLEPRMKVEENRHRNLYVMDVSNKEELQRLHDEVSEMAIPYRSPLLREKTRKRLEQQGIHTDGTHASLETHESANAAEEAFNPHITLGEIDLDKSQANITEVWKNLMQIEGEEITVSSITVFFYRKESDQEKAKLIDEVIVPLRKQPPNILTDVGLEMKVDVVKLGQLPLPIVDMKIDDLIWQFDIPVWAKDGTDDWNLTPWQVIRQEKESSVHQQRVKNADLKYPIVVTKYHSRFVALDGIHRIVKAYLNNRKTIQVKLIPEEYLSREEFQSTA